MSRLFSESLRHNPREGREMRRQIRINLDGSCELYEALCTITHARHFLGNIPGVFLMTMLPIFGKSRFEIAFVYPKFDGACKEREARNEIVPRDRWIDSIASQAAFHARRPDGEAFSNDNGMEVYVRCNSGHTRYVELQTIIEDVDKAISDYKVTSAERYKNINNEMLMLGQCDSVSHTPLLVYARSLAADQERNLHRKKEFIQNKKKEKETTWKSWDQSYKQGWKHSGYQGWEGYGGGYGSQSDSSYRWYSQKR